MYIFFIILSWLSSSYINSFRPTSFEHFCFCPHFAVNLCRMKDQTGGFLHFPGKPYTGNRCFLTASLLYINGCMGSAIPLRGAWTPLLKRLTCGRRFKQPVCTLTSHFRRWCLKKEGKENKWEGVKWSSFQQLSLTGGLLYILFSNVRWVHACQGLSSDRRAPPFIKVERMKNRAIAR